MKGAASGLLRMMKILQSGKPTTALILSSRQIVLRHVGNAPPLRIHPRSRLSSIIRMLMVWPFSRTVHGSLKTLMLPNLQPGRNTVSKRVLRLDALQPAHNAFLSLNISGWATHCDLSHLCNKNFPLKETVWKEILCNKMFCIASYWSRFWCLI